MALHPFRRETPQESSVSLPFPLIAAGRRALDGRLPEKHPSGGRAALPRGGVSSSPPFGRRLGLIVAAVLAALPGLTAEPVWAEDNLHIIGGGGGGGGGGGSDAHDNGSGGSKGVSGDNTTAGEGVWGSEGDSSGGGTR
jgi:hypothetical protein